MIKRLAKMFSKPKRPRVELRFVPYSEADSLLAEGWTIAPEEDRNYRIGMVYLELLKEPQ